MGDCVESLADVSSVNRVYVVGVNLNQSPYYQMLRHDHVMMTENIQFRISYYII